MLPNAWAPLCRVGGFNPAPRLLRLKETCFGGFFQKMSVKHRLNLPTQTGDLCGKLRKTKMEAATGRKSIAHESTRTEGISAGLRGRQTFS